MGYFSDALRFVGLKPKKVQRVKKKRTSGEYWETRQQLHYYQVVKDWISEFSPGEWIMDIGSMNTPIVGHGDFQRRSMLDIRPFVKSFDGVEQIQADWLTYEMAGKADVLLCLQVLEHLPDDIVGPFAQKLLRSGRHVIISVPFMWHEKACEYHLQDPVDLDKLVGWTGITPVKHYVETRDHAHRLIALFDGID